MLGLNSTLNFLLSLGIFTSETPKLIARTEHGKLEGTTSLARDGSTIFEFLGVPYAVPPLGELRFKVCAIEKLLQQTLLASFKPIKI